MDEKVNYNNGSGRSCGKYLVPIAVCKTAEKMWAGNAYYVVGMKIVAILLILISRYLLPEKRMKEQYKERS